MRQGAITLMYSYVRTNVGAYAIKRSRDRPQKVDDLPPERRQPMQGLATSAFLDDQAGQMEPANMLTHRLDVRPASGRDSRQ